MRSKVHSIARSAQRPNVTLNILLAACVVLLTLCARADTPTYTLGPGDHVRVTVFGHEDLSGEFEIDGNGRISLPLIKSVTATGSTVSELEQTITAKLAPDYLKNPRVSVEVLSYRPFYILGEVRSPGQYPYVSGMTLLNAVAIAGGYTYRAATRKVSVTRQGSNGKSKLRASADTKIFPDDVIEVPERFF